MVHCFKVAPMEKFDNFTCGRIDLMGDIVTKSAPYLYPFLIEFSLIGAGVLLIMWARIGKNPRWIILWNTFGWLKFSSNILNQYRCKSIPWAKHRGELYRKYPEIDHSSKKAKKLCENILKYPRAKFVCQTLVKLTNLWEGENGQRLNLEEWNFGIGIFGNLEKCFQPRARSEQRRFQNIWEREHIWENTSSKNIWKISFA